MSKQQFFDDRAAEAAEQFAQDRRDRDANLQYMEGDKVIPAYDLTLYTPIPFGMMVEQG